MRELLDTVDATLASDTPAALVRAVDVAGFGAAQYDNAMVIAADGSRAGEILRGVPGPALRQAVDDVLADGVGRAVEFRLTEPDAEAAGLSCGGRARLVIEPVATVPDLLWEEVRNGRTIVLGALVGHPTLPPSTVVIGDGTVAGSTGDAAIDRELHALGTALLEDARGGHRELDLGPARAVLDKVVARTRVVAVGGGEVVEALVDVTRALGWLYEVIGEPSAAIEAARRLSPTDALVVTSHDPVLGPDVLGAALSSHTFFIGALGARSTQAKRAARLGEMGFSAEDIHRVHGPVGLDLGARTAAETALAICAEILAVRSGRDLAGLRDSAGPINR